MSVVPYKVLPAKIGGEKGIALFNEYLGREVPLVAAGVKANEINLAKSYSFLPLLSNSRSRYGNLLLFFTFSRLIKTQRPTHLLIEHPYFAWLAWLLKKTNEIQLVIHSHNIEFQRSKSIGRWWWKALKWYELWAYKNADIVFFISSDDRKLAVNELGIDGGKSFAITYGIEIKSIPTDLSSAQEFIKAKYNLKKDTKILLFNGALYHHSNYDALKVILNQVNPILLDSEIDYKIIVCGKGLPEWFNELKDYEAKNIIYAGFVDDISLYFKGADIFLNPIMSGGGVKTKAIEAMAYNCTVISTENGANGIETQLCGKKLVIVPDENWAEFGKAIISEITENNSTPNEFFEHYYWGNIAKKVVSILGMK